MCGATFSQSSSAHQTNESNSKHALTNTDDTNSEIIEQSSLPLSHQSCKSSCANRKNKIKTSGKLTAKNFVRHEVVHDYHDHSYVVPTPNTTRKSKGGVPIPFPKKLYRLLEEVGEKELSDVVSWQPHGRAFLVHKPKEFVNHVLPTYFKQTKMGSFQRQLNLYGFLRITSGGDRGGYYHELFLRDREFLVDRMKRRTVKGTKVRGLSNPRAEPDFYRMNPVHDFSANPESPGSFQHVSPKAEILKEYKEDDVDHYSIMNPILVSSSTEKSEDEDEHALNINLITDDMDKEMINFITDLDDSPMSEAILFDESIF